MCVITERREAAAALAGVACVTWILPLGTAVVLSVLKGRAVSTIADACAIDPNTVRKITFLSMPVTCHDTRALWYTVAAVCAVSVIALPTWLFMQSRRPHNP